MGMKLQWRVLRSDLPAHLKPLALVLALISKDDGTGLWVRVARLAEYLGIHRATVTRQLAELGARGVVMTERRSGRRRATQRRLNADALELGRAHAPESASGLGRAHAPQSKDCDAPTRPNDFDWDAPTRPIKQLSTKPTPKELNPSVRPHDVAEIAPRASRDVPAFDDGTVFAVPEDDREEDLL